MAKYTFRCTECNEAQQMYVGPSVLERPCSCGGVMHRQMPTLSQTTAYEPPDKESGRKWLPDHEAVLRSRKEQYYWSVEVPRMVASGTYSVETMLENDWITLSDDGKVVVNTKPPSQR